MRTIFISIPWFHPAYKAGGPVQSIANLVKQYSAPGVNFKIFCSNADLDGTINQGIPFDEWCNYNTDTQVWYTSNNKRSVEAMRKEIHNCNPCVLFVMGIYSGYFNLVPLLFCKAPIKIISVRGMLHPGALSQKPVKKKLFLALWKIAGLHRRYCFHATDMQEKEFIQGIFGKQALVFIAGNFPRVFQLQATFQKKTGSLRLVSIALISPMKNILKVLEALQYCEGRILYDIYGPIKDEPYWQECLVKMKILPSNINVCYHNDLPPAMIEDALKVSEVFILPSKSENFGHAIYEALSAGKPVITSHHTPFNDLLAQYAGQNVSLENVPEMAKAIDFFAAMPQDEFASWNIGAHTYALKRVDINLLKTQYDQMFGNAVSSPSPPMLVNN